MNTYRDEVHKSTIGEGGYATESYYDDYTPEYYGQDVPPQQQQQQQQNYDENSTGWST